MIWFFKKKSFLYFSQLNQFFKNFLKQKKIIWNSGNFKKNSHCQNIFFEFSPNFSKFPFFSSFHPKEIIRFPLEKSKKSIRPNWKRTLEISIRSHGVSQSAALSRPIIYFSQNPPTGYQLSVDWYQCVVSVRLATNFFFVLQEISFRRRKKHWKDWTRWATRIRSSMFIRCPRRSSDSVSALHGEK